MGKNLPEDSEFILEYSFQILSKLFGAQGLSFLTRCISKPQGANPPDLKNRKENPHNQKTDCGGIKRNVH